MAQIISIVLFPDQLKEKIYFTNVSLALLLGGNMRGISTYYFETYGAVSDTNTSDSIRVPFISICAQPYIKKHSDFVLDMFTTPF